MVAVIKTGSSISRIVNYNENKVSQGVAQCIDAANYPADKNDLSVTMKLNRLSKCAQLNTNVSRNSVHISLNFDPTDCNLTDERLCKIARIYMDKIGFKEQPFLVYRHHDAGHPHIHIVSVKVRPDGSRIDMHNIGCNASEIARREIEKQFNLVVADTRKSREPQLDVLPHVPKVIYGSHQTKNAISNVLKTVLPHYNYTSLTELNAVLEQFHVIADRGSINSRTYKRGGLLYRALDSQRKPVGVPIKASQFYPPATLKIIEKSFEKNKIIRAQHRPALRNKLEQVLAKHPKDLQELQRRLKTHGVHLIIRQNQHGLVYGLTYIDHTTKCIFNGSALGKKFSANAVLDRIHLGRKNLNAADHSNTQQQTIMHPWTMNKNQISNPAGDANDLVTIPNEQTNNIMLAEEVPSFIPKALTRKRKKKRRVVR